jgi:hypothetical protein
MLGTASPVVVKSNERTTAQVGKGGGEEGSKPIVRRIDDDRPAQEGERGSGKEVEVISPPISISKGGYSSYIIMLPVFGSSFCTYFLLQE